MNNMNSINNININNSSGNNIFIFFIIIIIIIDNDNNILQSGNQHVLFPNTWPSSEKSRHPRHQTGSSSQDWWHEPL